MSIRTPLSKESLERLREEVRPLQAGLDLLPDHVMITDASANILYVNAAVTKETGYSREEIIGKTPGDLWGGHMPEDFYKNMWQTIKIEKKPFVGEVQNRKKDGSFGWQSIHIAPILDDKGEVRFFISVEPDITDQKEKEKFREEFVSVLGAQLTEPLTAAKWLVRLLMKSGVADSVDKGKLESIYELNDSVLALVSDLLAVAMLGNAALPVETFDLGLELEMLIIEAKKMNSKVPISFEKPDEKKLPLSTNKSFALQVFRNLIMNAVQYSDPATPMVVITLKKSPYVYLFSVENNGLMIPPEDQSKIFLKLFRTEHAKELRKSGVGLGLFIVQLIVHQLGWKIWFESPPAGKSSGAKFFVEIPIVE